MNILIYIVAIFGGIVGVVATLYATFSIPAIVVYKIYRSLKYHVSLYD